VNPITQGCLANRWLDAPKGVHDPVLPGTRLMASSGRRHFVGRLQMHHLVASIKIQLTARKAGTGCCTCSGVSRDMGGLGRLPFPGWRPCEGCFSNTTCDGPLSKRPIALSERQQPVGQGAPVVQPPKTSAVVRLPGLIPVWKDIRWARCWLQSRLETSLAMFSMPESCWPQWAQ